MREQRLLDYAPNCSTAKEFTRSNALSPLLTELTFLKNHREAIAAMDFFTVPTATFRVLYGFFVIEHGRRKILHFNVTESIPPVPGSCSNCERPSQRIVHPSI